MADLLDGGTIPAGALCPSCKGAKQHISFVDGVRNGRRCGWQELRNCSLCGGTGAVDGETLARYERGKAMREDRRARGLSLKQEADRLGIPIVDLADMERGREAGTSRQREAEETRALLAGSGGHPCPVPGCPVASVPSHNIMCANHWRRVPRPVQLRVTRLWHESPMSEEYLAARAEAVQAAQAAGVPGGEPARSVAANSSSGETVLITGNTYPVRQQLKDMGGRWDASARGWWVPKEKAMTAQVLVQNAETFGERGQEASDHAA